MDYDDRTQRIWQAFFPSSACAATPERMAISLLCALINLITKQETSIKNYSASLESLNFTNNSENMYRGGVRAGIYSKLFNLQKVAGGSYTSGSLFLQETITGHTVSPPRGNAQAGILHIPRSHTVQGNAAPVCLRGFFVSNSKPINQI